MWRPSFSLMVCAALSVTAFIACRSTLDEDQILRNRELVGSWQQIMLEDSGPRATTIRHFFLDQRGFLKVASAEIGTRSRVAVVADDVEYDGTEIRWKEGGAWFRGTVAPSKDAMSTRYGSGDPPTLYSFVRYPEGEGLWGSLMSAIGAELELGLPDTTDDGWQSGDLESAGIDRNRIGALLNRIASGVYADLHGMLLVKDDLLVLEEYFGAEGTMRGPRLREVFRDRLHHLGSTTKSITSLLIGIAIDRGFIGSVDVPALDLLPEYRQLRTPEKQRIRLHHLLTMTPGLEWEQFRYDWADPRNDAAQMWRGGDVLEYTLAKPMVAEPGDTYEYSNGTATLLGAILRNATGMEVDAFAEEHVFRPLGITDYAWTRYPDGSIETDGGLALRPRDVAKIGRLFLDGGEWQGERIVSPDWVAESTRTHYRFGGSAGGYGYLWQQMDLESEGERVGYYFMPGYGGNLLAVFPTFDLIVVFTGANYDWDVRRVYNRMLEDYLIPALDGAAPDHLGSS